MVRHAGGTMSFWMSLGGAIAGANQRLGAYTSAPLGFKYAPTS